MLARHDAKADDGWASSLDRYSWAWGPFFLLFFVAVWSKKAAEAALSRLREKILKGRHISPLCLYACKVLTLDEL